MCSFSFSVQISRKRSCFVYSESPRNAMLDASQAPALSGPLSPLDAILGIVQIAK